MTKTTLLFFISLVFVMGAGVFGVSLPTESAGTVALTATIASTLACNATSTTPSSFGTLSAASISTSTPDASSSIVCNFVLGCTLFLNDAGNGVTDGLATTSPAYIILSPTAAASSSATATLVAGAEGFGVMATTTAAGSGGTLVLNARYNQLYTGNTVGGLSTTTLMLASSTGAIGTPREVLVRHKASISAATQAGSYVDTLTYSCTGN